jgi:hypothetical protein|tara:strand:- start:763 stop:951 length:189 start_codon:yes stop_codon:yes gene_type:complete
MISNLIHNYLYPDDYDYAVNQIIFYENKILHIQGEDINENNKLMRIKKFEFVIDCIKYKYNI